MSNDEKQDAMLRTIQLMAKDRKWNYSEYEEQAKITDQNISDLLNPKINPGVAERTHDALSEESNLKELHNHLDYVDSKFAKKGDGLKLSDEEFDKCVKFAKKGVSE